MSSSSNIIIRSVCAIVVLSFTLCANPLGAVQASVGRGNQREMCQAQVNGSASSILASGGWQPLAFPFEELHRTLVALGGCLRGERAQISSLPRARIAFAGIQAILA